MSEERPAREVSRRTVLGLAGAASVVGAAGAWLFGRRGGEGNGAVVRGEHATPTPARVDQTPGPGGRRTLATENAEPGSTAWLPSDTTQRAVGGFAVPNSVSAGETVRLHLGAASGRCRVEVLRLGWYGGDGGRSLRVFDDVRCGAPEFDIDERRTVSTAWEPALEFEVPGDWQSGMYVARLDSGGRQALVPFAVKAAGPKAPIVVVSGSLTSAAYTNWGGYSLYNFNSDENFGAYAVSLDRPYSMNWGGGNLFAWELPLIRWLERSGFDADYVLDRDLHHEADALEGRKLVLLNGHHEYYSNEMYARLRGAVERGTNVALFGSNAVYWRVRFEEARSGRDRVMACYREAELDPERDPHRVTYRFRDGEAADPEARLFGVQYESTNPDNGDWVVTAGGHWSMEGTGLETGDLVRGLVGPEYDTVFDDISPGSTTILAASPLVNSHGADGVAHTTLTEHPSGARVFATGALNWNYSLDSFRGLGWSELVSPGVADERLQRFAYNVVDQLSTG